MSHDPLLNILATLFRERSLSKRTGDAGICLFLGAGADIGEGGLTFLQLKQACVEKILGSEVFGLDADDAVEKKFQNMFDSIQSDDEKSRIVRYIFDEVARRAPSDTYKLLILLAEQGVINGVITTNFDSMIERAERDLGKNVFVTYAPGIAKPYLAGTQQPPFYLKIHGCLTSGRVTHLSKSDIDRGEYDHSLLELLHWALHTHHLIICGYSGYDTALAKEMAVPLTQGKHQIFWVNPVPPNPEAPLAELLPPERWRFVRSNFRDFIHSVAKPVLSKPTTAVTAANYIRPIFEWRTQYWNAAYKKEYEKANTIRRRGLEAQVGQFVKSPKRLLVLAGPSGYGKSTFGLLLLNGPLARKVSILLLKAKQFHSDVFENNLADAFGSLGPDGPFSMALLDRWLHEQGKKALIYVDALNEYSPSFERVLALFRSMLRTVQMLRDGDSAIQVVCSIRQESWNTLLSMVDRTVLQQMLWLDDGTEAATGAITVGPFSDRELDAFTKEHENFDLSVLSPDELDRFRDPYLLGAILSRGPLTTVRPGVDLYREIFSTKLRSNGCEIDPAYLESALCDVAMKCLDADEFRAIDLFRDQSSAVPARALKDLGLIVDGSHGFLRFAHDRVHQYFLAEALYDQTDLDVGSLVDLLEFLKTFATNQKAMAALRMHYLLHIKVRFTVIEEIFDFDGSHRTAVRMHADDYQVLVDFAKDVVFALAGEASPLVLAYFSQVFEAAAHSPLNEGHLRFLVLAAASLPPETAVPLLARLEFADSRLATIEANIFIADRIVAHVLTSPTKPEGDGVDWISRYFFDRAVPGWRRLGRLLGLAGQLGPDNSHDRELQRFAHLLHATLDKMLTDGLFFVDEDVERICEFFISQTDRYIFNAPSSAISGFLRNPDRKLFKDILKKVEAGRVVECDDLQRLLPYISMITAAELEYHFAHILIVFSALNDVEATLTALFEFLEETCAPQPPPVLVDFVQAAALYVYLATGAPYDDRLKVLSERVLNDWPDVLLYRPGEDRGARRGFSDKFDMIFQDGFGVLFGHAHMAPTTRRRATPYADYVRDPAGEATADLTAALSHFLQNDMIEEAFQVIHALKTEVVFWPQEGLAALVPVIGHSHPSIHRAVVRVLAEAYHRHPAVTLRFLQAHSGKLSDREIAQIKMRIDPLIGRRQVEEPEWGRMLHFLLQRPKARAKAFRCLDKALSAKTPGAMVGEILRELGLYASSGQ